MRYNFCYCKVRRAIYIIVSKREKSDIAMAILETKCAKKYSSGIKTNVAKIDYYLEYNLFDWALWNWKHCNFEKYNYSLKTQMKV